ncbi:hypothetical protein GQ55_5G165400 [Panicum hallii var. hallii]|uniref:TF-B3 domain-containing protein n=1 Tax=Panicum hallii var. hallii TaxID=1504633 RepID=A0A2T7DH10_9POAL|nr:hypothetical protein GQ55_5G165400 [Panicum hallii var. hallii]
MGPWGVDRSGRRGREGRKDDGAISCEGNGGDREERSPRRENGVSRRPPPENLMHDVIKGRNNHGEAPGSSHGKDRTSLLVRAAASVDAEKAASASACHDFKFGDNQVSDALLARLFELGASAPRFVDAKRLQSTDVRVNQNRLQLPGRSPISRAFTDAEKARLRTSAGMPVAALDSRGREYEMTCKLWKADKHYRFMGQGWRSFREAHHLTIPKGARLTRRVEVELWAFRSRALPPPEGEDGGEEAGQHQDGALALVVLLRDDGEQEGVAAAAAPAESYTSMFRQLAAAAALLTVLIIMGGANKRKRDDDSKTGV